MSRKLTQDVQDQHGMVLIAAALQERVGEALHYKSEQVAVYTCMTM